MWHNGMAPFAQKKIGLVELTETEQKQPVVPNRLRFLFTEQFILPKCVRDFHQNNMISSYYHIKTIFPSEARLNFANSVQDFA